MKDYSRRNFNINFNGKSCVVKLNEIMLTGYIYGMVWERPHYARRGVTLNRPVV
jgi:hypothetical protein